MEAGLGSGINLPGRRRARPVGGRASTTVWSSRWAARGRNSVLAASSLLCEGERETSCWLSSRPLVERELLLLFVSVSEALIPTRCIVLSVLYRCRESCAYFSVNTGNAPASEGARARA